jgi:hypothetical protein
MLNNFEYPARRVFLKQTGPEVWNYFVESRAAAAFVGFQVAAWTSFTSGILSMLLAADVPYTLPDYYNSERRRETELVTNGQFERTSEFAQHVRVWIRLAAIGIAVPSALAGVGAIVVLPITIPFGTATGLIARYWLRRTILKASKIVL